MLYFFILCTFASSSSTTPPETLNTHSPSPAVPSGINLSPEIYVENTDVHIDPKGQCNKEIGLMINEAPVYLEISGQVHRINGYYSFGMIDNCGAPFTLEQGSVPSFSTCSIQRCDCNYGVQEWDCVTRQCPAHTVWWQNSVADQGFSSYQSDVLEPSADSVVREKYAFIDGYISEARDIVITRLEYDCQSSNLNHICQHLFKNIITQVGKKVSNIHIPMPEHNAKDECECALMPLTADKKTWRVLIDSHEHGYMFDTVLFTMPEGSQLDRQEAVLNFCINEQSNYKNRFWKIISKEHEGKCKKPICPFTGMQTCPPNSEWSKRQCPVYDECCQESYEHICPCCVSFTDNTKCIARNLQMIRPQQIVKVVQKQTGLIICITLIVLVTAVAGLIFKSQNKRMNPRNRRNTFGEYIPDSKPDLSVRAQTISSRRLLEDDFEMGASFHALLGDTEIKNGLEPVAMT